MVNKYLIIVRHAKSSWDMSHVSDFDRPLKDRGIKDAYHVASRNKANIPMPDVIYTSPAARASATAIIFAKTWEIPMSKILLNESFYDADELELLNFVKSMDDSNDTVMICGHNPSCSFLANYFLPQQIDNLPTTGLVILHFDISNWNKISKQHVMKAIVDFPKKDEELI